VFATPIVSVFNSEGSEELQAYGTVGLQLYSIGFLFACVNIIIAGFFGAVDRPRECAIISIIRGVVAIVLFALLFSSIMGIVGVWLAFVASELLTFAVSFVMLSRSGNALAKSKQM
jgi:Na+-driven multidrug efflux pump